MFLMQFLFQSALSSLPSLLGLARPSFSFIRPSSSRPLAWPLTCPLATLLLLELPERLGSSPSSRPTSSLLVLVSSLPNLLSLSLSESSRRLLFLWTMSRLDLRSFLVSSSELSSRFLRWILEGSRSDFLVFLTNFSI